MQEKRKGGGQEVLEKLKEGKEVFWENPGRRPYEEVRDAQELSGRDIDEAERRLLWFAPLLQKLFPELEKSGGIIESELCEIPRMKERMEEREGIRIPGRLLLKKDSHLPVAGSVKARGGIYEVLWHTEDLARREGLLKEGEGSEVLAGEEARRVLSTYTIQVGSTGNLGLSIGIMSAALGYRAIVHMSRDARQWKKDLLRAHGVEVLEVEDDYSEAVRRGRLLSEQDPKSYFVDDENSRNLFLGYAVAARRLKGQLEGMGIEVDEDHPLAVYLPCGVGGAPGGIAFGLREIYGDALYPFFAEPVQAPCMLAGMASGLGRGICVSDLGLSGNTEADGLAVGRCSGLVASLMEPHLAGGFTVKDERLFGYLKDLYQMEGIFLEPSALAGFAGVRKVLARGGALASEKATHLLWATGGGLVPEEIRREYLQWEG